MSRRTRSTPKSTPSGSLDSDGPQFTHSATDEAENIFWPWSTCDPLEQLLEKVINSDHSRLKTPSPKMSSRPASPPEVNRRPRRDCNCHQLSNYSSDLDIPEDEAHRIRESSRQNGSILFERFNQKYVPEERSSPESASATRNARRVLDSPYGSPLPLPGAHMAQSGAQVPPQDAGYSESKAAGCK